MSSQGGSSKSNTPTSAHTPLTPHDGASSGVSPVSSLGDGSASATPPSTASDVAMESPQEQGASDGLDKNLDWSSGKPESSKNIAAVQEGQQGQESPSTPRKGEGQCCSSNTLSYHVHTAVVFVN